MELLEESWLNDISIDQELLKIIKQDDDKKLKLSWIAMYYKIKPKPWVKEEVEKEEFPDFYGMSSMELDEYRRKLLAKGG
jgi:hypothetical protein